MSIASTIADRLTRLRRRKPADPADPAVALTTEITAAYRRAADLVGDWPRDMRLAVIDAMPTLSTLPQTERKQAVDEHLERCKGVADCFKVLTLGVPGRPADAAVTQEFERLTTKLIRRRVSPKQAGLALIDRKADIDDSISIDTTLPSPNARRSGSNVPPSWRKIIEKFGGRVDGP